MSYIKDVIDALWEIINIDFSVGYVSFTLWDVILCGSLLSLIGLIIGKIFLFALNRR